MWKFSWQSAAFRICGGVFLIACAIWQILSSFQEQKIFSEGFAKTSAPANT